MCGSLVCWVLGPGLLWLRYGPLRQRKRKRKERIGKKRGGRKKEKKGGVAGWSPRKTKAQNLIS